MSTTKKKEEWKLKKVSIKAVHVLVKSVSKKNPNESFKLGMVFFILVSDYYWEISSTKRGLFKEDQTWKVERLNQLWNLETKLAGL